MKSITLYRQTATGAIQLWQISALVDKNSILIKYGQLNGALQEQIEQIKTNNSGRSMREQIKLRIKSRLSKQRAKGYRNTVDEAIKFANKNELNMYRPMLAQQFNKQKSVNTSGAILQRKLDGNRMLVTRNNGELLCYTRNGKLIKTLDHIVEQMDWLDEGQTVDGEVYRHGMALKDIRGGIAKKQASTLELNYHIYDVVKDMSFQERWKYVIPQKFTHHDYIVFEPWAYYQDKETTEYIS